MPARSALARSALVAALVILAACASAPPPAPSGPLTATTSDGVTVYGEPYLAGLDASAPLVLLFHQAGANGRGEYAEIAAWLNAHGVRAIAWDQRSGGDRFGSANRTVAALPAGTPDTYCDAYPDLVAAVGAVAEAGLAERVFVWGSSYSAALAVRLAAEHPERVAGALAFSPAAGGPMAECRAREWLGRLQAPLLALRPASEMGLASTQEQRDLFVAAGATVEVVEHGVHGSSMLVDSRTEHDMADARARVLAWIRTHAPAR